VDADCDTADIIRTAECGTILPPGDLEAFIGTLQSLVSDPATCKRWGCAARQHILKHLDAPVVLANACDFLENFRKEDIDIR
jgi:glycosyltransferase involved in cell wall biosynthesis